MDLHSLSPSLQDTLYHRVRPLTCYATSRMLIVLSLSRRTVKGNSAVVRIGMGRHRVGSDNSHRPLTRPSPRSSVGKTVGR
jgi:hypothetical protein